MNTQPSGFFEGDTQKWFDTVEQILLGADESVQKNSLLRIIPISAMKASGADASLSSSEIRDQIIRRFDATAEEKLRQLLEKQTSKDQKQSSALRHLKSLAPVNESVVRFLEMLPVQIRVVLAMLDGSNETG